MKTPTVTFAVLALSVLLSASACEKQEGQDQQTPNSSPTSTSPMNPE